MSCASAGNRGRTVHHAQGDVKETRGEIAETERALLVRLTVDAELRVALVAAVARGVLSEACAGGLHRGGLAVGTIHATDWLRVRRRRGLRTRPPRHRAW
jgi:hypothetical protein